jgi:hypothetical protein
VPATIIGTASRGRKATSASGVSKVRWHRDLSPAHTSQAVNTGPADRAESVDGRALRSWSRRQLPDVCRARTAQRDARLSRNGTFVTLGSE